MKKNCCLLQARKLPMTPKITYSLLYADFLSKPIPDNLEAIISGQYALFVNALTNTEVSRHPIHALTNKLLHTNDEDKIENTYEYFCSQ